MKNSDISYILAVALWGNKWCYMGRQMVVYGGKNGGLWGRWWFMGPLDGGLWEDGALWGLRWWFMGSLQATLFFV